MAYFYHFELILAGIILLTGMAAAGISLWIKRRRESQQETLQENEEKNNNTL